jgi:hypothetical protein
MCFTFQDTPWCIVWPSIVAGTITFLVLQSSQSDIPTSSRLKTSSIRHRCPCSFRSWIILSRNTFRLHPSAVWRRWMSLPSLEWLSHWAVHRKFVNSLRFSHIHPVTPLGCQLFGGSCQWDCDSSLAGALGNLNDSSMRLLRPGLLISTHEGPFIWCHSLSRWTLAYIGHVTSHSQWKEVFRILMDILAEMGFSSEKGFLFRLRCQVERQRRMPGILYNITFVFVLIGISQIDNPGNSSYEAPCIHRKKTHIQRDIVTINWWLYARLWAELDHCPCPREVFETVRHWCCQNGWEWNTPVKMHMVRG